MMMDWVWGWGPMFFMTLVSLLIVAIIVVAIVLVARSVSRDGSGSTHARRPALEILEERFARGEIDREEFEERRRALLS
jgi:putative membrane protein